MRTGLCLLLIMLACLVLSSSSMAFQVVDLQINEICPTFLQGVADEDPGAWFELYNPLDENVSTEGIRITDESLNVLAELPVIIMPPGSYLLIQMGTGTNDFDASDGTAVYCVGRSEGLRFPWDAGAIAVFRGEVDADNLRDFIAWGTLPLDGSAALNFAVAKGLWTAGAFVDLEGVPAGSSFGLAVPGDDRDEESPWAFFSGRYDSGLQTPGERNILMSFPRPGEVLLGAETPAGWVGTSFPAGVTSYQVNLDRYTENGDRVNLVNGETLATSAVFPVEDGGEYLWRVDPCENGDPLGTATERTFYRATFVGEQKELAVPFMVNLKDTGMLCTVNLATMSRPGCGDTHWNIPHDPGNQNSHDTAYSARAALAMINRFFGGNLSQDRISYEVFKTKYALAEGALGHELGFKTVEITPVLRWSLGGITTQYAPWAPPFDYLRAEIDLNHPILFSTTPGGNNRECAVITGYAILRVYGESPPMPAVKVLDPRSAASYWILYSFLSSSIQSHWQITGNPVGILQESSLASDSDGDGILDFDETAGNNRYGSSPTSGDTDGDGISDLLEIYCYTFHDAMHPGHGNDAQSFPDVDGDGRRAENDTDTDAGGRVDGLEDLNHNGIAPEGGETCPLLSGDDGGMGNPAGVVQADSPALHLSWIRGHDGGSIHFRIVLPESDHVSLVLFGADGRMAAKLAEEALPAGLSEITWGGDDESGRHSPTGVYFVRLATTNHGGIFRKLVYLQ